MTPLARRFFGQLTKPIRHRVPDPDGLLKLVDDLHCFDVSAISEAVEAAMIAQGELNEATVRATDRMFLPAPRTWLETCFSGEPGAFMLEKEGDEYAVWSIDQRLRAFHLGYARPATLLEADYPSIVFRIRNVDDSPVTIEENRECLISFFQQCALYLDIINTPGLVGLKTHQPHRRLERDLRRAGVGRYPLRAWNEIVLKAHPPALGDEEREGHLTGRKCLHFVRAHRRHYERGLDTVVSAHWRGDAALGMKRTRYRVEQ